jgi:hypothetical protein
MLATRSLSRGRTIFDQQVQELVKEGSMMLVQHDKEEWLLSKIKQFPMDQDKYMFELSQDHGKGLTFAL